MQWGVPEGERRDTVETKRQKVTTPSGTRHRAVQRPQQSSQEANPKIQATTLENKGVAAPSLSARTLVQERFDL